MKAEVAAGIERMTSAAWQLISGAFACSSIISENARYRRK